MNIGAAGALVFSYFQGASLFILLLFWMLFLVFVNLLVLLRFRAAGTGQTATPSASPKRH